MPLPSFNLPRYSASAECLMDVNLPPFAKRVSCIIDSMFTGFHLVQIAIILRGDSIVSLIQYKKYSYGKVQRLQLLSILGCIAYTLNDP